MNSTHLPAKRTPSTLMHLVVAIGLLIIFFSTYHFWYGNNVVYNVLIWNSFYLSLWVSSAAFKKYKIGEIIYTLISLPAELVLRFAPIIKAALSIVAVYDLMLIFFMIIFGVVLSKILTPHNSFAWSMYWVLTATSIAAVTIGDKLIKFWHRVYEFNTDEAGSHIALSLRILNTEKAKFLVYVFYFILLLIFNSYSFGGVDFFNISKKFNELGINQVVLQAFATFIAYDAIVSCWRKRQDKTAS